MNTVCRSKPRRRRLWRTYILSLAGGYPQPLSSGAKFSAPKCVRNVLSVLAFTSAAVIFGAPSTSNRASIHLLAYEMADDSATRRSISWRGWWLCMAVDVHQKPATSRFISLRVLFFRFREAIPSRVRWRIPPRETRSIIPGSWRRGGEGVPGSIALNYRARLSACRIYARKDILQCVDHYQFPIPIHLRRIVFRVTTHNREDLLRRQRRVQYKSFLLTSMPQLTPFSVCLIRSSTASRNVGISA